LDLANVGSNMLARMAMSAITTNSSINVKPLARFPLEKPDDRKAVVLIQRGY
jgi:hypothetical protein